MGRPRLRRERVRRRPGSRMALIDATVLPYVRQRKGTPSTIALAISAMLGFPVTRQEVWHSLNDNMFSKKSRSPVPSFSVAAERAAFLHQLNILCTRPDQILFIDEKKWRRAKALERFQKYGYAPKGERLPLRSALLALCVLLHDARLDVGPPAIVPRSCEVVGAIGVTEPRPLRDGRPGTLGLVSYQLVEGTLSIEEIVTWFEDVLAPMLNPFPGPRSLVVLDNMPQHRSMEGRFRDACSARGAILLWNPPNSPDLNPIEKLWDVAISAYNRRHAELLAGLHGPVRPFALGDAIHCLNEARLSLSAYYTIFTRL